ATYYRQLPKVTEGEFAGYPQALGIAHAYIAHTDSRFDPDSLKDFENSYQAICPLMICELWSIPILLHLVLVENMRRFSLHILSWQESRIEADKVVDALLGLGYVKALELDEVIEFLEKRSINSSFAVQLIQRLRYQEERVGPFLQYLQDRIAKSH